MAVLAMAAAAHQSALAQASVAGKWVTEFDIGIRNENGVETSMGKRQATITLTLKGDSVSGTWQAAAVEGSTPAPVSLKGTIAGGKVKLQSDPVEHTVRMNDDEQQVKIVSYYTFELHGDLLSGTTRNSSVDGSFNGPDREFSAKRSK